MNATRVRAWLFWFSVLAATAAVLLLLRGRMDKAHVTLAFLLVVLAGSAAEGRALGVSLAGAAFLVFNWLFLRPYNTLTIEDPRDWLVLLAFLATGIVAAQLLERQRRATESASQRADEIDRLATLGAETLKAPRAEEALDAIAGVIREAMGVERCAIFRWDSASGLRLSGRSPATDGFDDRSALLSYTVENAAAAAERADGTLTVLGDSLLPAGREENAATVLADITALGIPLSVRGQVVGALRLSAVHPFDVSDDQRRVLGALSYYAALGVERMRLAGAEEEAESLRRADRLKDALLTSVSHDLRTPLTAIKGIANEIWRGGDPHRAQIIEEEADRLSAQVDDLLALSQLNAGVLPMSVKTNAADDVVGAALDRVESVHGGERIDVHIANDDAILAGDFDFMHTMRALTNLLENALKYSPSGARVQLDVALAGDRLRFTVQDHGPGVATGDEQKIFAPFYRSSAVADGVRGTGLGLAIARQLIEAQRGTLKYAPRDGGGSSFTIELPAVK